MARTAARLLFATLVLLGCAVAIMPFAPVFPSVGLDAGWSFAVNAAVGQGLVFGRDLVFTFGPYASLYTLSYDPVTDGLAIAASLLLTLGLTAGLVTLASGRRRWCALLLVLLLSLLWLRDPLFFITPLVFLALTARTVRSPGRLPPGVLVAGALLAAGLAVLPLVKGTFAAGTAAAFGLGVLLLLVRGRWRLAVGAVLLFLAAMAAFWVAAHQPLAALPGFFTAQSRIVGGYTEAMALPGPLWQVAVFAAAACAVLATNLPQALRAGLPGLVVLAGAALLLFLGFKAGFVRQDEHVVIAAGAIGLIAAVLAVVNPGRLPVLGMVAGLACWAVLAHSAEGLGPRRAALRMEDAYRNAGKGLLDRLAGGSGLRLGYADSLAAIRASFPLPPLTGSTDIYSAGQSLLLAHGLRWDPRPVLQSYSAYSPALAEDDARHLEQAGAPENVLVKLEPIDNRFPALEDGPSWLPLLDRYEAASIRDGMAILHRLPGPASTVLGPPGPTLTHMLGQDVALPAVGDEPLWARIDVQPTLWGRLLAVAFKPPPLRLVAHLGNGRTNAFRFVSGMGRAGFVISPLVADSGQMLALQLPGVHVFDDYRMASFSIDGDPASWRADYTLSLTPIHLPPRPDVRSVLFQKPQPTNPPASEAGAKCWLDQLDGNVVDHAKPLVLSGLVRLTGWGFGTADEAADPDSISVVLRREDGATTLAAPADLQTRPDVGAYFHQPQLARIGFQSLLDLQGLSGRYTLALALQKGAHHWTCPLGVPVDITAAP